MCLRELTFTGAAYFLSSRSQHPMVEHDKEKRKNPIPQMHPDAAEEGHNQHESVGRRATR